MNKRMIQRIQSIFLLLSAACLGSNFAFPFAHSDDKTQMYFEDGLFNIQDNHILLLLIVLTAALAFLTIFLYKYRLWQIRLSLITFLLIGATMGMLIMSFLNFKEYLFGLGILTPGLALIFSILAYVYIKKDDNLVKSMDRLR